MEVIKQAPPHDNDAEKSVIACILLNGDCLPNVMELLRPEDFYNTGYRAMYNAALNIYKSGAAVDVITLQNELKRMGVDPFISNIESLKDIVSGIYTSVNYKSYAQIVRNKAVARKYLSLAESMREDIYAQKRQISEIVETLQDEVFALGADVYADSDDGSILDAMMDVIKASDIAQNNPEKMERKKTGFQNLDYLIGGLKNSELILVAARPSMGKTAFALNVIEHLIMEQEKTVALFSLEMSKQQLMQRFLAQVSGVPASRIEKGVLNNLEWDMVLSGAGMISKKKLFVFEKGGITISEIRNRCRKLKLQGGLDAVFIDYLQLIGSDRKSENRQQEISEISRSLKALAKELDVPVIALSQLSRAPEARSDHRPMLSDLRESGSIEQDADVVISLYRDEYYNPETEAKGIVEVIVGKNRNGPVGTARLVWIAERTKFCNPENK